jgi:hypothetical protein
VYPDFQLEHLLSSPGNFHGGDAYEAGRMEVEWEQAGASSAGGIPAWAYPQQGDRIYTIGSHVADCGHGFELNPITSSTYRAEIHPPRCVAVFRNAALSEFAGGVGRLGSTYQRQWATRVDVSASSYGGPALTNAGAPSEYQAMNGQDITFDVHAPPRPSFDATLKIAYIDRGEQGGDVTAEAIGKIDSSETDASKVKVHFQGNPHKVQPETAAKTVYLYWTGGPSQVKPHVRNYTVTVLSVTTQDMLGALPGPSLLSFYGYVNARRRAATPHRLPRHLTNSSHPGDCAHRRDGRGDLYRRRIRPTAVPLAGPNRARFVATNWVGAADDLRAYSTMAIGDQAVDATCLGPCFTVRYEIDPM